MRSRCFAEMSIEGGRGFGMVVVTFTGPAVDGFFEKLATPGACRHWR